MKDERVERAAKMLRIAAKVIEDNAPSAKIEYDGAICDGLCVAEDCRIAADMTWHEEDE